MFGHDGLEIPPQMRKFYVSFNFTGKRFLWRTILKGQPHFVCFFYKNKRASKEWYKMGMTKILSPAFALDALSFFRGGGGVGVGKTSF